MTRSIPFHKQTNVSKQAGQQTFDRMPFLKHSTAEPQQEQYISQSHKQETTRITFEEWFTNQYSNPDDEVYDWSIKAWNAALKQGKL